MKADECARRRESKITQSDRFYAAVGGPITRITMPTRRGCR